MELNQSIKYYLFLICILLGGILFSQKKKIKSYNNFIKILNNRIDSLATEQNRIQQYHQDIFRFYTIFDTLQVSEFKDVKLYNPISNIPRKLTKEYLKLEQYFFILDSLTATISKKNDLNYSQKKVDSINLRLQTISNLSEAINTIIKKVDSKLFTLELSSRKKSHKLMLKEIKKIEFLIDSIKTKKLFLNKANYYISEKVRVKLPQSFLSVLELFKERLKESKLSNNKEKIIHYFIPEKYFDKWILKKYSLHYWQVKYLEDALVTPIFHKGIKANYNITAEKYGLLQLKNITPLKSNLSFTYTPLITSPLGYSKEVFVILILDISNSMNESNKLSILKKSVKEFVEALRRKDLFSIILFSNTSQELILPSDDDKEYIKYKIDEIKAFGNTLPESAIFRAYNIMNLKNNKDFKNQIILITDGIFEVSGKMKYHIKQGAKNNIRFSIIKIENEKEDLTNINNLTELSNGKMYLIDDKDTYKTIIKEVLR